MRSNDSSPEDGCSSSSTNSGSECISVSASESDGTTQCLSRHCFTFVVDLGRTAPATAPGSPDFCFSRDITGDALQKVNDPVDFFGLQWLDPGIR